MKKIVCIIAVFVALIGCYNHKPDFSLQNYFNGNYCCYTNSPANQDSINLGFCYENKQNQPNKIGETVCVQNLEVGSAIKDLDAKVVKTEYINGANIIYAYTNKIKTHVVVEEKKVNLQFACYNNYCIIGWPLILGSY